MTLPPDSHWFEPLADHMGPAYLRYSFTKGTVQEIDFLVDALGLVPGMRILDVGCGPGRHAYELANRGMLVHGIDISQRFIDLAIAGAPDGATFQRLDARTLVFEQAFDAAICLCQGAFGLMTTAGDDQLVIQRIAAAIRPGGVVAMSAFSSYFVVKYFAEMGNDIDTDTDTDIDTGAVATFDADSGVNHERTTIRDPSGTEVAVDLWTGCYTPRELRLLCAAAGLSVESINGVEPGAYRVEKPSVETPEFLVIARRVTS